MGLKSLGAAARHAKIPEIHLISVGLTSRSRGRGSPQALVATLVIAVQAGSSLDVYVEAKLGIFTSSRRTGFGHVGAGQMNRRHLLRRGRNRRISGDCRVSGALPAPVGASGIISASCAVSAPT
jgi:hypothetical protein